SLDLIASMIPDKYFNSKQLLLLTSFFVFSFLNSNAQDVAAGKALFQNKCATCHSVFTRVTGPALAGFQGRGKWADIKEFAKWVHNPAGYMAGDSYTQGLKQEAGGAMMSAFPELKEEDLTSIAAYINKTADEGPGGPKPTTPGTTEE